MYALDEAVQQVIVLLSGYLRSVRASAGAVLPTCTVRETLVGCFTPQQGTVSAVDSEDTANRSRCRKCSSFSDVVLLLRRSRSGITGRQSD